MAQRNVSGESNHEREMKTPTQPGFFDLAERANKLTEMGDPLVGLNAQVNWEAFRTDLIE